MVWKCWKCWSVAYASHIPVKEFPNQRTSGGSCYLCSFNVVCSLNVGHTFHTFSMFDEGCTIFFKVNTDFIGKMHIGSTSYLCQWHNTSVHTLIKSENGDLHVQRMWWLSQEGQSWKSLPQQVPCTWEMIAYLIAAALREDHTSLFYPCDSSSLNSLKLWLFSILLFQPQHPNRAIQGGFIFWFQLHAVDHMLPCGVHGQHWCLGTSKKTKKNHMWKKEEK